MTERTCTVPDCLKPHRARGLCSMHWKRKYGKRTKYPITCRTCGNDWLSERRDGQFCSDTCKGQYFSKTRVTRCPLPSDHPVVLEIQRQRVAAAEARRAARAARRLVRHPPRECPACAARFTPLAASAAHMVCCSRACSARLARRRRRARERNTTNQWRWSDFMRIARKFDYCCAYCGSKPTRLDPDHVVPLSRGGDDAATNLLPTCATCNSDKSAQTLAEWAAWRAAQGKPPRVTSWDPSDPRYQHLTHAALLARQAAA